MQRGPFGCVANFHTSTYKKTADALNGISGFLFEFIFGEAAA
jgi:hypothetical protein